MTGLQLAQCENFSETEILAQLEVTGHSAFSLQGERRTVRLKLSQVNSASMDSFHFCTINPGRLSSSSQQLNMLSKRCRRILNYSNIFRPPLTINKLHIIVRRSAQLDWLRFKRPMLTSFQKVMAASEQDFRATK